MTDDEIKTRQLNAIVGAAIKALADSGVDDELIGSFAANHRAKVARLLGQPEEALQPPDLQLIIRQEIASALADAGVGKGTVSSKAAAKRINVIVAGHRTSVTLGRNTVAQLVETKGEKLANEFIQEIANSAPADVDNRSGWVEERLKSFLAFGQDNPTAMPRH